jgi:hypothetical protein
MERRIVAQLFSCLDALPSRARAFKVASEEAPFSDEPGGMSRDASLKVQSPLRLVV